MTHRVIVEALNKYGSAGLLISRLNIPIQTPIYKETIDNIIGVVSIKASAIDR